MAELGGLGAKCHEPYIIELPAGTDNESKNIIEKAVEHEQLKTSLGKWAVKFPSSETAQGGCAFNGSAWI